jgi:hypothetical protein
MAKKRTIVLTLLSARLSSIFIRLGSMAKKMVNAKNVLTTKTDNYSLFAKKSSVFQPIIDENLNLFEVFFMYKAWPYADVLSVKNTKRN